MPEVYVIVADSARARVLHTTNKSLPLNEIHVLEHPEGRMHTRDLTSDLPGRDSDRAGLGKHRMDSATDPKHHELVAFSKTIANYLDDLVNQQTVDQLMVVAPPAMLGILREQISSAVSHEISFELDKNLAQFKPDEIRSYLPYFKPVERIMT